MTMRGHPISDRRGLAALEFALMAPMLLAMLGGVTDFGFLIASQSQLTNGIAQGARFALLNGPLVHLDAVKSFVDGVYSRSTLRPAPEVTVEVCTACPVPTGSQVYLVIRASYTYQPLMPYYSHLVSPHIAEAITVKLQ